MSALVPSPLDYIGRRRFAFYPAIKSAEPNEWLLGASSWSEVQVINSQTGAAIWVPRRYVGAVSETHDTVLIVGLTKHLEYQSGQIKPAVMRVIEMPQNATTGLKRNSGERRNQAGPASVVGIRVEDREDSPMNKALLTFGAGAVVISLLAALIAALTRF